MARCPCAQRRRAAADGNELHARVHRDRDVLAEPRDLPDGEVPVASRGHADDDRGRPASRHAQPARCAAHRGGPGGQRRDAPRAPGPRLCPRPFPARPQERQRARAAAGIDTLATLLRERGYHVAIKGKWHLSKPVEGGKWGAADPERIERDYGFADWEPPDAGGDAKAETFGGGNAGTTHAGWDEDYTRQMEAWLAQENLPEPFCLVFSLVNPHDVLGYPSSYERGGYATEEFRGLGVPLPPTIDEDLRDKPTVQALTKLGQTSYIGAVKGRREQQDYVDFYAHLHRVVDEKIGRLLSALGDPARPGVVAGPHGDRADLRPRRAGPVARRPATEDVQCLRGVDPGAAGRLEPGAVSRGTGERRARVAGRPRSHVPRPCGRCAEPRPVRRTRPRPAAAR